jgi:hypothetical protein
MTKKKRNKKKLISKDEKKRGRQSTSTFQNHDLGH